MAAILDYFFMTEWFNHIKNFENEFGIPKNHRKDILHPFVEKCLQGENSNLAGRRPF